MRKACLDTEGCDSLLGDVDEALHTRVVMTRLQAARIATPIVFLNFTLSLLLKKHLKQKVWR